MKVLESTEQFSTYNELYDQLLSLTAGPADDPSFDELAQSVQALYVAAFYDAEIMNGRLSQFFCNGGDAFGARAAESLRRLGLVEMAEQYEGYLRGHTLTPAFLPANPQNTASEAAEMSARYPSDSFDEKYVQLWRALDFSGRLLLYANEHFAELQPQ